METFYTKNSIGVKYSHYDIYKHNESRLCSMGLVMKVNGLGITSNRFGVCKSYSGKQLNGRKHQNSEGGAYRHADKLRPSFCATCGLPRG